MSDPLCHIRTRAEDPRTRTDRADLAPPRLVPPASPEQIEATEASLDFPLPEFLRRVYTEIANGGFGPGLGLIGVPGGATDEHGNSIVDLYDSYASTNPDDDSWRCFDLTEYEPGRDLKTLMVPQQCSLESWLRRWAEGVDLWQEMFPLESG
jgi:hypothetical protein